MDRSRSGWFLRVWTWLVLLFVYFPLFTVVIYSFNKALIPSFPPDLWTLHWFSVAFHNDQIWGAVRNSRASARTSNLLRTRPTNDQGICGSRS